MSIFRDLHVQLQERYRRVAKAHYNSFQEELGYLRTFIEERPALMSIVETAAASSDNPEAWVAAHAAHRGLDLPPTEDARLTVNWWLLGEWASGNRNWLNDSDWFSTDREFVARAHALAEHIVEPLVDALQERLGTQSEVLHLLARFAKQVEWFDRDVLYEAYRQDTRRGEAVYDVRLRRFLFEQGIDNPYSKPRSASGEADAVALLETDDPLVCELKLFNNDQNRIPWVAGGAQQALRYAKDYHKPVAHLVIINLSPVHLQLPSEAAAGAWPPRITVGNIVLFFVVVTALPMPSASNQGRPEALDVSVEDLLKELVEE